MVVSTAGCASELLDVAIEARGSERELEMMK